MAKIYISAPFFSQNQINKVKQVEQALKANPTVSQIDSPRLMQQNSGIKQGSYAKAHSIYRGDVLGVKWCDAVVGILDFDGKDTDSGSAYEMGGAKFIGKPLYTISFDKKSVNLMLGVGSDYNFKNIHEIERHNFNLPTYHDYTGKMTISSDN